MTKHHLLGEFDVDTMFGIQHFTCSPSWVLTCHVSSHDMSFHTDSLLYHVRTSVPSARQWMHHSHMLMISFYTLKRQHILLLCNSEILVISVWLSVLPSFTICLKIYYPETNLLPENHSYISVATKRKKSLCWNIPVEHTKGSPTDELWTIPWDTAQHESLGIYRFPQYLWVIWSLQLMKINSSISMSVLSHSLLHGTCQIIYKSDSQYIAKII